jgi:transposase
VLVELGVVEQRLQAVREVLDGASVTDVARRNKVARQTVHDWLRRYAAHGLAGLIDKSSKPDHSPLQMPPEVEAQIIEMRRKHPGWGPRGRSPSPASTTASATRMSEARSRSRSSPTPSSSHSEVRSSNASPSATIARESSAPSHGRSASLVLTDAPDPARSVV